ncbi:hypothetical protein FSP39_009686 [Pinctada imbricata]|uniref:Impact N-terminal domain-containing protein n=1 Tax=Pinctada imbricata TaxID=66713 RepID=A0AA88XIA9_PINIB|nr:hypothetical protein FSP39_009686 [Pinctada imbricata]
MGVRPGAQEELTSPACMQHQPLHFGRTVTSGYFHFGRHRVQSLVGWFKWSMTEYHPPFWRLGHHSVRRVSHMDRRTSSVTIVPWLRGEERQNIDKALSDIVCENLGESILYLWIEKIRELLEPSDDKKSPSKEESGEEEDTFDEATVEHLLSISCKEEQPEHHNEVSCPEIIHGEPFVDRRSRFQGHIAEVIHTKQVRMVLDTLYENKKIAEATHNIYAYRIFQNNLFYQGCEDDGEIQAGSRLLHLLQIIDGRNVLVVVTRWYGGIHLGPDRFKHINNCARILLDQGGYIKSKEEKRGPKSSKKKR